MSADTEMKYMPWWFIPVCLVMAMITIYGIKNYFDHEKSRWGNSIPGSQQGKIKDPNGITSAEFSETKEFVLLGPGEGGSPYHDVGSGLSDLNIYIAVPVEFLEVPEARTILIDACSIARLTPPRTLKDGKSYVVISARLLETSSTQGKQKIWTSARP